MRALYAERSLISEKSLTDEIIQSAASKVVYGALPLRDNESKVDMIVAVTARALRRARDAHFK
jgi:CO/xanthine dehydrogenase FAD-binding subunit